MEIIDEKDLEMVAGGASKTVKRTAMKESCFCCKRNKFILYLGTGGTAVCEKCGQVQVILEWIND